MRDLVLTYHTPHSKIFQKEDLYLISRFAYHECVIVVIRLHFMTVEWLNVFKFSTNLLKNNQSSDVKNTRSEHLFSQ